MNLLSLHTVMEYLIGLRMNNDYEWTNSLFKQALEDDNLKTLKVRSLTSATRHFVYKFELAGKTYILKQFTKKNDVGQRTDLDNNLNYFENELQIFKNNWDFVIVSSFIDKSNKVIIQEYFTSKTLNKVLETIRNVDKSPCTVLKILAEKIKKVHQKTDTIVQPFMVGNLKTNILLVDYYKDYVKSWEGNHFIHGDFTGRNILLKKQDNNYDARIIDWELSGIGDIYFDLSSIVCTLCFDRIGIRFFDTFDDSVPEQYLKLRKAIDCFLDAYEQGELKIDRNKLKTFLIINTQHLSNNVGNLIKNIKQVFPS
jgi:thiamine kinase-like enzyme